MGLRRMPKKLTLAIFLMAADLSPRFNLERAAEEALSFVVTSVSSRHSTGI